MKVLIFGSNGLVGSSLSRILKNKNTYKEIFCSTRNDTDLFSFEQTFKTISEYEPNIIINAAAKVGGIVANNNDRFEFILENLKININILESLKFFQNIKLINLGSSCIYPLGAEVPIKEESIMGGKLEPTNSPYAMAKLAAIEMGDALSKQYKNNVINLMPTNLYGPFDNFSETKSHVIPGLIKRMHDAKSENRSKFDIWGTGTPLREFLHSEDFAEAVHFLIENNINTSLLNIGSNEEISIKNLAILIKKIIDFEGELIFDTSKPDGNPRKLLDSSKIMQLGWKPLIGLEEGLEQTYLWFKNNLKELGVPK